MLILLGATVLGLGPVLWWKDVWAKKWRWWQSVLFFAATAVWIAIIGFGVGQLPDTRVQANADQILAQLAATLPDDVSSVSAVTVDPTKYSTNTTLQIPYQGDRLDYTVEFTAATASDGPLRCLATVSIIRQHAPKGPVFAQLTGSCSAVGN